MFGPENDPTVEPITNNQKRTFIASEFPYRDNIKFLVH